VARFVNTSTIVTPTVGCFGKKYKKSSILEHFISIIVYNIEIKEEEIEALKAIYENV